MANRHFANALTQCLLQISPSTHQQYVTSNRLRMSSARCLETLARLTLTTCRNDSLNVKGKTLDEATQTVRDFLAGRCEEMKIVSSTDKSIRKAVACELLAALSRLNIEERDHARRLFMDHGYLDDAMQELGTAALPNERAMAARALGIIANPRGVVPLVYALLDDAPEVRRAAEQALTQISGPVVANLGALLEQELNVEADEVV